MNRNESIQAIEKNEVWDIVIVGGGATGLGCAIDAANRGYKTLLIEQHDFAKSTSSKATKLLHGGVRYLAQGNIALVREALKERSVLLKNAPHLCEVENFIIPCFSIWQKVYYGIGLKMYDLLSGKYSLGKTQFLSKHKTISLLPDLKSEKIKGGILYKDGQFDDARLAVALAVTATQLNATLINYFSLQSCVEKKDSYSIVQCKDEINDILYKIQTKLIINATGIFAVNVEAIFHQPQLKIAPSQGVHIVLSKHHFNANDALMIPETSDGRVLFAVPWQEKIIIGTTDTLVDTISLEPKAQKAEIDFIISHFNQYCKKQIQYTDIQSVFSGLRPLVQKEGVKSTKLLNRNHVISINENVITITGGKWTTYRKMAEDVLNKADTIFEKNHLYKKENNLQQVGESNTMNVRIANISLKHEGVLLHPDYPYTEGDLVYCVHHEMIQTPEDFLARRIRLLFLDVNACLQIVDKVIAIMAELMQKNDNWKLQQREQFEKLTYYYTLK